MKQIKIQLGKYTKYNKLIYILCHEDYVSYMDRLNCY